MKTVFWVSIMVLTQISRSRFKQSNLSLCSSHISTFWTVLYFWGNIWVYLGVNNFSQRISKIDEKRKFGRFDVVLKNW